MHAAVRPAIDGDLRLLNDWQHGFPLCRDPFGVLADATGRSRNAVLHALRQAQSDGRISRIGGVFAHGSGGDAMLAAMAVPENRIDEVAAMVSAHPGVNHNYLREHRQNLWFVMTGIDRAAVDGGVTALEAATGLRALRLRMVRPYRIDLGFDLRGDTATQPMGALTNRNAQMAPLDPSLWPLAQRVEAGLPLVERPYALWATELGWSEDEVTECIGAWLAEGRLKRFGVVVRHHDLGFAANAMTVFDVPDSAVDAAGEALAAQAGVTLAYRRERAEGWPFNLYAMVHGTHRQAVMDVVERMTAAAKLGDCPREVLFSTRRFKQTGGRRFRGWIEPDAAACLAEERDHAVA
ncbi:Lrp/AsnC family transcriptional regulator [Tibeticola sp.]|jgi:DNA-binding Lrp family transcriptional regulator|uniref:siroheme decarboxylase subunit beta n=1 Tax=Tibeticola sp. TaxID=2005368 RepID=UPI00258EAC0D|nr:Lrp/AsnC family transcriptional regulator [Tibeticola sp.]MCI4439786.1 Lrp/AsnC family transcriptional regulator [Tibeticola sp.]